MGIHPFRSPVSCSSPAFVLAVGVQQFNGACFWCRGCLSTLVDAVVGGGGGGGAGVAPPTTHSTDLWQFEATKSE
jgi:hypothetical protein